MTKQELWLFSFVCRPGRAEEAKEALSKLSGVNLDTEEIQLSRVLRSAIYGAIIQQSGVQIEGTCEEVAIEQIVEVLSSLHIAGYSRETQVIGWPLLGLPKAQKRRRRK